MKLITFVTSVLLLAAASADKERALYVRPPLTRAMHENGTNSETGNRNLLQQKCSCACTGSICWGCTSGKCSDCC